MKYKHTQISYLMMAVTLSALSVFAWAYLRSLAEPPSYDSGPNFLVTSLMVLVIAILTSFITLQVSIDENYFRIKFGYGLFQKKFSLKEIASVKSVKNRWYYGWGIRLWFWPKMWIFNFSGFDAIEITLENGNTFRIGTNEPKKLEQAIYHSIS